MSPSAQVSTPPQIAHVERGITASSQRGDSCALCAERTGFATPIPAANAFGELAHF
jgi:hypothetical protein